MPRHTARILLHLRGLLCIKAKRIVFTAEQQYFLFALPEYRHCRHRIAVSQLGRNHGLIGGLERRAVDKLHIALAAHKEELFLA